MKSIAGIPCTKSYGFIMLKIHWQQLKYRILKFCRKLPIYWKLIFIIFDQDSYQLYGECKLLKVKSHITGNMNQLT